MDYFKQVRAMRLDTEKLDRSLAEWRANHPQHRMVFHRMFHSQINGWYYASLYFLYQ